MSVSDTINFGKVHAGNLVGPASYSTTGILLDLSATFAYLHHIELVVETVGSLIPVEYEITLNRNASGVFTPGVAMIDVWRLLYSKGSVGNAEVTVSGTTVQASKTATATTVGSSHTHDMTHDHPSTNSSAPTAGGEGVNATAGGVAIAGHIHAVDIDNFAGSTTAATHTHNRSFEYEHAHGTTKTETDATRTEVLTGTNLSTVTWRYVAVGF